ncbi:MAG: nuclear transport factor 2 family protein, partial [Gammaproteobacteria bacterium]|nr:nuclear transport factor 2 family protein [Gammaproteobacteria bacterium]
MLSRAYLRGWHPGEEHRLCHKLTNMPGGPTGVHAKGSLLLHNILAPCEIDGDVAHCESYVLVILLNNDGESARLISGRYIDRLERREEWKIALRRTSAVDVLLSGDASIL